MNLHIDTSKIISAVIIAALIGGFRVVYSHGTEIDEVSTQSKRVEQKNKEQDEEIDKLKNNFTEIAITVNEIKSRQEADGRVNELKMKNLQSGIDALLDRADMEYKKKASPHD